MSNGNCMLPGNVHRAKGCHLLACRETGGCTFFTGTAPEGGYMASYVRAPAAFLQPDEHGVAMTEADKSPSEPYVFMSDAMRTFATGATRSSDAGRIDPEGFLNPLVIERFCEYMNKHRVQADGSLRASDNWQKGTPTESAMKGMWRHFLHLWTRHRGYVVTDPKAAADAEEDLCAILFNVEVYLLNLIRARLAAESGKSPASMSIGDSCAGAPTA